MNISELSNTLLYQNKEFTLGDEQYTIAKKIITWLYEINAKPYVRLSGFAGSGKSLLIAYLIQNAVEVFPPAMRFRKVAVCTYTWRAALVLRSRGVDAQSIHSIFYKPLPGVKDKKGNLIEGAVRFAKRSASEIRDEYSIIIIDEASMVSSDIRRDIESVGLPVLYVGDPGQ